MSWWFSNQSRRGIYFWIWILLSLHIRIVLIHIREIAPLYLFIWVLLGKILLCICRCKFLHCLIWIFLRWSIALYLSLYIQWLKLNFISYLKRITFSVHIVYSTSWKSTSCGLAIWRSELLWRNLRNFKISLDLVVKIWQILTWKVRDVSRKRIFDRCLRLLDVWAFL